MSTPELHDSEEDDESTDLFPPAHAGSLIKGDVDVSSPVSTPTAQEYEARIRKLEQLNATLKENISALYAESTFSSLENGRETREYGKPSRSHMELSQDEAYSACTAIIPYSSNADLQSTGDYIRQIRKLEKSKNKLRNKLDRQKRVISQLSSDLRTASNKIEDMMASKCDTSQPKQLMAAVSEVQVQNNSSRVIRDELQSILHLMAVNMERNSAERVESTERFVNKFHEMDIVHNKDEATETFSERLERVIRVLRGDLNGVANLSVPKSDDNGIGEKDGTFSPVQKEQSVPHPAQSGCTSDTELLNNEKSTIEKCPADMVRMCSTMTADLSMSRQGGEWNAISAGTFDKNESLVLGSDETPVSGECIMPQQGLEENDCNENANAQHDKSVGRTVHGNDGESHENESINERGNLEHDTIQSDSSSHQVSEDSGASDKELAISIHSHLRDDYSGRDTSGCIGQHPNDEQHDRSMIAASELSGGSHSAKRSYELPAATQTEQNCPASIFDFSLSCLVPSKSNCSRGDPGTHMYEVGNNDDIDPANHMDRETNQGSSKSDLNYLSIHSLKTWDTYAMRRRKSNFETPQHTSQSEEKDPLSARLSRRQLFEYMRTTTSNSVDNKQILAGPNITIDFTPPLVPPSLPSLESPTAPKFKKGLQNGYFVYKSSSGNEYLGDWKGGKRHGHGMAKYRDGEIYYGEWVKGQRHGFGTLYLANSKEVFDGSWYANKKHGLGTYFWSDGEVDVSLYEHDVRKESLRWSKDRNTVWQLDLKTSKKTKICLHQAAMIFREWKKREVD